MKLRPRVSSSPPPPTMSSATYDPERAEWVEEQRPARPSTPPIKRSVSVQEPRPVGCAVCISIDRFHSAISNIHPSVPGTMRCSFHTLRCACCTDSVDSDTQLFCASCELTENATQALAVLEGTSSLLSWASNRLCIRDFFPNTSSTCGCVTCIRVTHNFFTMRAMEEGLASSPTREIVGFRP